MSAAAPWWQRLPSRLLEEDADLSALMLGDDAISRGHRWVRGPDGDARAVVDLRLGTVVMQLEIRFPPHYPDGCPSVRPLAYDGPFSTHQYVKSGILCLELGPDNWHPHYTVADMIRSAHRLVVHEVLASVDAHDLPSREVEGLAVRVRRADGVLLRTPSFEAALETLPDRAEVEFAWPTRGAPIRVLPTAVPKGSALQGLPPAYDREVRLGGEFRRLNADAPAKPPSVPAGFDEYVEMYGGAPLVEGRLLTLLQWPGGATRGYFRMNSTVLALADMPFQARSEDRVVADVERALAHARVAIIGLGSLGSKIAVSLARSGTRRFILVDSDVLGAENVCRHAATLADVGLTKVAAVSELLRDVSFTEPEIEPWTIDVGAATNPDLHAELLEAIGGADVIVDATANPDAFGLLAMVASDRHRPMVWGEVFGGGVGGLIGFAHPAYTPCPRCVRAGFHAASRAWPSALQTASVPYGGGDEEPIQATDADVAHVAAAMMTRIEDLLRRADSQGSAVTLLGLRRGWLFDAPMQNVSVPVRSDDVSCERCWVPPAAPDADATARANALFTSHVDAEDSSTG